MSFNHQVQPTSLYIHWPFCPYKCHFCDFVALAAHDQYMAQYHEALSKELCIFFERYQAKLPIETIYLGGGTPSTYPTNLLLDTFGTLYKYAKLSDDYEISIEVNPGTVSDDQLVKWSEVGINRISIGVQSLNEMVLKKLNRHQSTEDIEKVLASASQRFRALSIDLIVGLPGISDEQWKEMLKRIMQWPIAHISIYFLMVHEQTPLYFGIKKKEITLPCDDQTVDLYYWSIDYLAQHQFEQYEISSFARPGFQSKHNTAYWQRKPFKGFGLGAWSFDGAKRIQNEKNLMNYMAKVQTGDITFFQDELSPEQTWIEKLMLGLRQRKGVGLDELFGTLPDGQRELLKNKIDTLQERGLIVSTTDDRLRLLPKGLSLENEIIDQLSVW